MPYESKNTMTAIISKVLKCLPYGPLEPSAPFQYKNLKKILKLEERMEPVIPCERTLKQIYRDLVEFDFISDEEYSRINLDKCRSYLAEQAKPLQPKERGSA